VQGPGLLPGCNCKSGCPAPPPELAGRLLRWEKGDGRSLVLPALEEVVLGRTALALAPLSAIRRPEQFVRVGGAAADKMLRARVPRSGCTYMDETTSSSVAWDPMK